MRRTTITLDDELALLLEREARRKKTSVSAVVRERLTVQFVGGGDKRELPFAALGRSGYHDTARNTEAILAKKWNRASGS